MIKPTHLAGKGADHQELTTGGLRRQPDGKEMTVLGSSKLCYSVML